MQEFRLTIFNQLRSIIGIFSTPFIIVGLIILGAKYNIIWVSLLLFILYLFIAYYFIVGYLTVTIKNEQLFFDWQKKIMFNYSRIKPIKVNDITTIIIDNKEFLRKIKTSETTITINTTKIRQKEALRFIKELKLLTANNNIRYIDSWDVWADKGYLKIAYRINLIITLSAVGAVLYSMSKGIQPTMLPIVFLIVSQNILFGLQMKSKIRKAEKNITD